MTTNTLEAVEAIEDPEQRLQGYSAYLQRLAGRQAEAKTARIALVKQLRRSATPPTYRHLAELTGLTEGYLRSQVGKP